MIMSLVDLSKIFFFGSVILWLLPPIRHNKGSFFLFFLILALLDPVSYIYAKFFQSSNLWIYILFYFLLIVSVVSKEVLVRYKYSFILITVLLLLSFIYNLPPNYYFIIIVLEHLTLLLIFIKNLITTFANDRKINLFYLMLVIYELLSIFKFFNLLIGFADAIAFFIITSIFQIAFGLFFSIFREDNPRLIL